MLAPGLRAERDVEIIGEGRGSGSSQSMMEMPLASIDKSDCDQPHRQEPLGRNTDFPKNHQGQS